MSLDSSTTTTTTTGPPKQLEIQTIKATKRNSNGPCERKAVDIHNFNG